MRGGMRLGTEVRWAEAVRSYPVRVWVRVRVRARARVGARVRVTEGEGEGERVRSQGSSTRYLDTCTTALFAIPGTS